MLIVEERILITKKALQYLTNCDKILLPVHAARLDFVWPAVMQVTSC